MRKAVVGIFVAAIVGTVPSPASAEGPSVCRFSTEVSLSPGLSSEATSGEWSSGGETGTIECDGWVAGRHPTGPGPIVLSARYGTTGADTCASGGEGNGVQAFTIPTDQGPLRVEEPFTFLYHRTGTGGVAGTFQGKSFSGTFEATPAAGDCATSALTRVVLQGEGRVRGWNPQGGETCGGSAVSA